MAPVGDPQQEMFAPKQAQEKPERPVVRHLPHGGEPVIRLDGVTVGYHRKHPLIANVDFEVAPGEVIGLVGVSGTGKTSLLKTIAGITPPLAGDVEVLAARHPRRPPRGSVGYIPQRLGLVMHASVMENLLMGTLHRESAWRATFRTPSRRTAEQARIVLEQVGLSGKEQEPVNRLSGGQQRRVAVARALLQRPRVLLADEFLSELDRTTAKVVEDAVLQLATEHGTAIVLVEHHVRKARHMAHRVFEVHAGLLEPLPEPPGIADVDGRVAPLVSKVPNRL